MLDISQEVINYWSTATQEPFPTFPPLVLRALDGKVVTAHTALADIPNPCVEDFVFRAEDSETRNRVEIVYQPYYFPIPEDGIPGRQWELSFRRDVSVSRVQYVHPVLGGVHSVKRIENKTWQLDKVFGRRIKRYDLSVIFLDEKYLYEERLYDIPTVRCSVNSPLACHEVSRAYFFQNGMIVCSPDTTPVLKPTFTSSKLLLQTHPSLPSTFQSQMPVDFGPPEVIKF
jgi:hypothetical protein